MNSHPYLITYLYTDPTNVHCSESVRIIYAEDENSALEKMKALFFRAREGVVIYAELYNPPMFGQ